ncbi:MAG: MarR family transcriptional regulator [Peptoniphilaceae bacterium]|nr:MarR family transcriptional regulator [Peptoniphilaceae bacterium]
MKDYGIETNQNLKTLIALSRTFLSVRRRETKTIRAGGLTVAQFAVIEVLYHKGALPVQAITQKVLTTSGNMTMVIQNLRKMDMVEKLDNPKDKRSYLLKITDKGKKLFEEIFPPHLDNINEIFSVLDEREKNELIKILKKLGEYKNEI